MESLILENNTYSVVNIIRQNGDARVDILWGKTDIRCLLTQQKGGNYEIDKIMLKRNQEWFEYIKVSGHGLFFEEIYAKNKNGDVYIELPKNLKKNLDQACKNFLP